MWMTTNPFSPKPSWLYTSWSYILYPREKQSESNPGTRRNKEFFPQGSFLKEVDFPFPVFFRRLVKGEWAKPASSRQFQKSPKPLFSGSSNFEIHRCSPSGCFNSTGTSTGLVSEDDGPDRKADGAPQKSHKAMAFTIRPVLISRAVIVWTLPATTKEQ